MAHGHLNRINHLLNRIGELGEAEEHRGGGGKEQLDLQIRVRVPRHQVHHVAQLLIQEELVLNDTDLRGGPLVIRQVAPHELPLVADHEGGDPNNLILVRGRGLGLDKAELNRVCTSHLLFLDDGGADQPLNFIFPHIIQDAYHVI
jgi:hypothetical protein